MKIQIALRTLLFALTLAFISGSPVSVAHAAERVILTVSGESAGTGEALSIDLTLSEITAFEPDVLRTTTIWTDGEIEFKGVRLEKLFALIGLKTPARVRCKALNEYAIEVPMSDTERTTVLVAFAQDGAFMRVRDKGPLWIIYPRESGIRDAADKMIWQLRSMKALY